MKQQFYFYISVFAIAVLGMFLTSTYSQPTTNAAFGTGTEGDPFQVCAAGCAAETIHEVVSNAPAGSYVEVQDSYNSSTESWPVGFLNENITLSCATPDIRIGPTSTIDNFTGYLQMTSGSVITGCTIYGNNDANYSQIIMASGAVVASNTVRNFSFDMTSSSVLHNNDILFDIATSSMINMSGENIMVSSNTISYTADTCDTGFNSNCTIFSNSSVDGFNNVTIASNTMTLSSDVQAPKITAFTYIGENLEIRGNSIRYDGTNLSGFVSPFQLYGYTANTSSIYIQHNTIFASNYNGENVFFDIQDNLSSTSTPMYVTSTYNVVYFDGSATTSDMGVYNFYAQVSTSLFYEDFNSYSGQVGQSLLNIQGVDKNITSGNNSVYTRYSVLKDKDADDTNNFELAPYSNAIDIDGDIDAGALDAGARGNSFTIDDTGVINYTTVHATSTEVLTGNTRTDDTWTIAAGTYLPFSLTSSSLATTSIIINGNGENTFISGNASTPYGISVNGLTGVQINDLVVTGASSTIFSDYALTNAIYEFDGNSYGTALFGDPDISAVLLDNSSSCEPINWDAITSEMQPTAFDGSSDWNLVLVNTNAFGPTAYFTFWVPSNVAATAAAINAGPCSGFGISVDKFITSTFSNTDGVYTYAGEAYLSSEGVTMKTGFTNPPTISRTITESSGIIFVDASNNSIGNVTSTNNRNGISFTGSSATNLISSSTLINSVGVDVYSDSTGTNTFDEVGFTRTSSTIENGAVLVTYRPRVYVENEASTALNGVGVSLTAANLGDSDAATTTGTGYTDYTRALVGYTLTSSSLALTNGGYNPYTITANASSTYASTSTVVSLFEPAQEIVLAMRTASLDSPPTAPNSVTSTSITTSSITFSWTDNSVDETSFLFDYASGASPSFPGTTSNLAANATSTVITSLIPNTVYTARVAAVNGDGTSSYATSGAVYTNANIPGTPTASATGQTTMTVSWSANSNAAGTVYELYNVTDSSIVATTTEVSYAVTGLTAATSYQFKVRALYQSDNITYSAYSSTSTAVATTATGGSSGGGGSYIPPSAPNLAAGIDAMTALKINAGAATTNSQTVTLSIVATNVSQMAISNTSDFSAVSFVPFSSTVSDHVLTPGNGEKRVYVKLRSSAGGTLTIMDAITLTSQAVDAPTDTMNCPVGTDIPVKLANKSSIYYITTSCTKLSIRSQRMYFTYFTSWNAVQMIDEQTLNSIPVDPTNYLPNGPLYRPQFGALVKQPNDPKVYLILNDTKFWIANPAVFEALGYDWTWIEGVDPRFLDKYPTGSEVTDTTRHPNYTIIKYTDSPKVYRLEPSSTDASVTVQRWIPTEDIFYSLQFRDDRIIRLPANTSFDYSNGPDLIL